MKKKSRASASTGPMIDDIEKIISYLYENDIRLLDDEEISYKVYPFSCLQFIKCHDWLKAQYPNSSETRGGLYFPEYRMYFEIGGKKFVWRTLRDGFDVAYQIVKVCDSMGIASGVPWPQDWPMAFDEKKVIVLK